MPCEQESSKLTTEPEIKAFLNERCKDCGLNCSQKSTLEETLKKINSESFKEFKTANMKIERTPKTITVNSTKKLYTMIDTTSDIIIISTQPIESTQVYFHDPPEVSVIKALKKEDGVIQAKLSSDGKALTIFYRSNSPEDQFISEEFKKYIADKLSKSVLKECVTSFIPVPPGYMICEKCGEVVKPLDMEDEDSSWCQCPKCNHRWGHSINPGFG